MRPAASYRGFCRIAAAAFAVAAAYSVALALPAGELADAWLDTTLHVVTGAAVGFAGWRARSDWWARASALSIIFGYGALGAAGWFVDGVWMNSPWRLHLDDADNVFHLLLALAAAASFVPALRGRKTPAAAVAVAIFAAAVAAAAELGGKQAAGRLLYWQTCARCGDVHVRRLEPVERRLSADGQAIEPARPADRRSAVFSSDRAWSRVYVLYRYGLSFPDQLQLTPSPRPAFGGTSALRRQVRPCPHAWSTRARVELVLLSRAQSRMRPSVSLLASPLTASAPDAHDGRG